MFIINLTYKVPLEEALEILPDHMEYLKEQYKKNHFLMSGKKVPRDGGIILSNVENKAEIIAIVEQDPFVINDVVNYEIIEFIASTTSEEIKFLAE